MSSFSCISGNNNMTYIDHKNKVNYSKHGCRQADARDTRASSYFSEKKNCL